MCCFGFWLGWKRANVVVLCCCSDFWRVKWHLHDFTWRRRERPTLKRVQQQASRQAEATRQTPSQDTTTTTALPASGPSTRSPWLTMTGDQNIEEVEADTTAAAAVVGSASEEEVCAPEAGIQTISERQLNTNVRRIDDDDFDQGFRNQRHRPEPPPGTRIRRGLLEIAEDHGKLHHKVAAELAKLTADNYDDEYVKDTFNLATLKLVVEQPFKIPFVAAVLLYANTEKSEIAANVIAKVGQQMQEAVEGGRWREFKLLLRFVACVSRIFEEDGVLPILDELFDRAADLQAASSEDAFGFELVKIILLTIPYLVAYSTDDSLQQKVSELLERTGIIAGEKHALQTLVDPYPESSTQEEKPMACENVIQLLQSQVTAEASNGWKLSCIPRPYEPDYRHKVARHDEEEGNGETNGDANTEPPAKHAFPSITVPAQVNTGSKVVLPEIYFSVFADQEIESVPPTSDIASSLLRDAVIDTINILDFNRNIVAKYLTEIDCFWNADTFVKRSMTFDKLRDVEPGKPTWKSEDVCIDAIFSQLFTLPTPEHRVVYYHSLITESCKISPGAVAPTLGRAIRFLFRNLAQMDMELFYRFMDWFAHHLSNFEFRWKWTEW